MTHKEAAVKYCPLREKPTLCKGHECMWWIALGDYSDCAIAMIALK